MRSLSAYQARYAFVQKASSGFIFFFFTFEIRRPADSYALDTPRQFQRRLPTLLSVQVPEPDFKSRLHNQFKRSAFSLISKACPPSLVLSSKGVARIFRTPHGGPSCPLSLLLMSLSTLTRRQLIERRHPSASLAKPQKDFLGGPWHSHFLSSSLPREYYVSRDFYTSFLFPGD